MDDPASRVLLAIRVVGFIYCLQIKACLLTNNINNALSRITPRIENQSKNEMKNCLRKPGRFVGSLICGRMLAGTVRIKDGKYLQPMDCSSLLIVQSTT